MTEEKKITCCPNHTYYRVPLIWTFKFIGAEFWCPLCGEATGMMGNTEDVPETEELTKRREIYKNAATPYLSGEVKDWELNREAEHISCPE